MQASRRGLIALMVASFLVTIFPATVEARRGRVRLRARGLRRGQPCPGYPVMSRATLRACVNSQEKINSKITALEAEDSALRLDAERIRQWEQDLDARQKAVDPYSQESVDAYNALLPEYEKLVAEYNRKVAAQSNAARLTNESISPFNTACAKRCYYDHDMDAVLDEREAAQRRSAQPRDKADHQ